MIGRTLDGFRIVGLLGRGGMGEVWKAEQVALGNRLVALKLLRADRAIAGQAVQRIQQEGVLAAALKHPGIAQVYAAGEADGMPYVAMEYVDGESLAKRLGHGALAPAEARRVVLAVADALAHAHGRDVLHRDVTPNNIMLEPGGRVVLLDFGLALALGQSRLTSEGVVLGTVHYIAPEVLRRFEADARGDVYALGVVFYEALAGAPPFAGERREQVEYAMLHETPDPPGRRRAGLPAAWDHVALRAIAREPGLRFQSMREFAAALQALETPAAPAPVDSHATTAEVVPRAVTTAPAGITGSGPRRIAVIPFTSPGASQGGDDLAAGFAQAISASLSRFTSLQVLPPLTTAATSREGPLAVAREFGADLVLGGTLQESAGRLRVSWTLVRGTDLSQARAGMSEARADELFDLQDRVVRDIAVALGATVPAAASRDTAPDPAHHERYLQALGYLQRFDSEASIDGATTLLEALTRDSGASADTWSALGHAYRQKFAHTQERAWLERAVQASLQAAALAPDSAEALTALGRTHALLGREQEAADAFGRALQVSPANTRALLGLVDLQRAQGKLAEAEATCRRAIAIRPDYWGAHNALGAIHFQAGRWDEALGSWREVTRLTPDNPRGWYNIGAACFHAGRLPEARAAYSRSLELGPTAAAHAGIGTLCYYSGDMSGAREAFERAVSLRPRDALMWGNLGDACRRLPNGEERAATAFANAIRLSRERLELNPRDAGAMGALAGWLSRSGDIEAGVASMRRALELNPDHARNTSIAVTVYELAGEREQALFHIARAIALGCDWSEFELDPDLRNIRMSEEYQKARRTHTTAARLGARAATHDPRPGSGG